MMILKEITNHKTIPTTTANTTSITNSLNTITSVMFNGKGLSGKVKGCC